MALSSSCGGSVEKPVELIKAEPSIGIGILEVSLNRDIPLYRDFDSAEPFDRLGFSEVEEGNDKGKFLIDTTDSLDLKPFKYYPGDSEDETNANISRGLTYVVPKLIFKVLEQKGETYCVVLNEETFETAVIKRDRSWILYLKGEEPYWWTQHFKAPEGTAWLLYETWEEYLSRVIFVSLNPSIKVYDSPGGKEISKDPIRAGRVTEMSGNWMKLGERMYDTPESAKTGWVRWTDGVQLLVRPVAEVYR